MPDDVITVREVHKRFGHVHALRGVSFSLGAGEILAIVGDNGAGKSTMASVISGALTPDEGQVHIGGAEVSPHNTRTVSALGVETVYQNLALAPDLSIAANLFLGREKTKRGLSRGIGVLDKSAMLDEAEQALARVGWDGPPPTHIVRELSGGQQQAIAIARAMVWATRAILMDEPTAALAARQMQKTNDIIRRAAAHGLGVAVITHDIPNMLTYADRILVMRRGKVISELTAAETSTTQLVELMVGRDALDGDAA